MASKIKVALAVLSLTMGSIAITIPPAICTSVESDDIVGRFTDVYK
jgi:hypothetical protein